MSGCPECGTAAGRASRGESTCARGHVIAYDGWCVRVDGRVHAGASARVRALVLELVGARDDYSA